LHTNFCQSILLCRWEKGTPLAYLILAKLSALERPKWPFLAREARFHLAGRISLIATGRNAGGYKPNTQLLTSRREGLIASPLLRDFRKSIRFSKT
jgi:hypothetical protein